MGQTPTAPKSKSEPITASTPISGEDKGGFYIAFLLKVNDFFSKKIPIPLQVQAPYGQSFDRSIFLLISKNFKVTFKRF